MAVITPRIRWGSREVDWTWVPASTDELAHTLRPLLAEAVGVLAFTFVAGAAIVIDSKEGGLGILGMAVATAAAYAIIVSALYPVSGGHINPAVTLGMVAARRMPPSIGALYGAAQCGGAIVGALLLNLIFTDFVSDAAQTASLAFHGDTGLWAGGFLEAILTFMLVLVFFRAFVDPKGDRALGAFGMGLVVLFGFLVAWPLTGGALNLARVFGTNLVAGHWTDFGSYWLGLAGGFVAGLLYEYLFAAREEA
ncbi:MAG TPA: aquaporin [Dehalococcoidia bacterium]|nr:aquaporin [Dehalococcoidia bacterium]